MSKNIFHKLISGAFMKKAMVYGARRGPSRYILRSLDSIESVKALGQAFQAEEDRSTLLPVALDISNINKLLVLAPHTDDEVIGCGGLMLLCKAANIPIEVFFTTDSHSSREEITKKRYRECSVVMQRLAAQYSFSNISNIDLEITPDDVNQLVNYIMRSGADVICYPWLFDHPIKHRLTNIVLYLAIKADKKLRQKQFLGYQVHNHPLVNSYVDITAHIDEKCSLINEYESQVSKVNYAGYAQANNLLNSRYIKHYTEPRYHEVFHATSGDEIVRWVEKYYLRNLPALFRQDAAIVKNAQSILSQYTR